MWISCLAFVYLEWSNFPGSDKERKSVKKLFVDAQDKHSEQVHRLSCSQLCVSCSRDVKGRVGSTQPELFQVLLLTLLSKPWRGLKVPADSREHFSSSVDYFVLSAHLSLIDLKSSAAVEWKSHHYIANTLPLPAMSCWVLHREPSWFSNFSSKGFLIECCW